ncbi:MAG: hypothetical protein LRZ85_03015 [Alphaproteobacteria bacterium]|nr:hypothetical protein [Alphaproteobacteria bacterium]MCD8526160.1 hypothetical protein [Alphaproteobacteria bacterium]
MHLSHSVEGIIDGVYDDGPHNKILTINFNGHADELPEHLERGYTTSKFLLRSGILVSDIHIGTVIHVTDIDDRHPPGVHHITGIAVPELVKG